jgi:hypothetical protein
LATFALGTAVGDMTAVTLHLGYLAVTRKDVNGTGIATESAATSTTV